MAVMEFANVSFRYPTSKEQVLKEVSFQVQKGEFIVLCGASGSGKTTLLKHMIKSQIPIGIGSGSMYFAGADIETMDDLLAYKENAEVQIQQLARQRKILYRQKREPERAAREEKIKALTQQMKALRHEVYICSDIEADAAEVQEKLRQAELAAQEERNEVKQDEQRRRSSRSDGAGSLTGYRSSH